MEHIVANKSGRFVYRGTERTAEDISRKASEGARMYDSYLKGGIPTFKPKEGENCIRILPSTWEEPDWDLTIQSHYGIGPDNGRYLCLKMKGESCPICDLQGLDKEEADQLRASKGAICWIIDRDNEKAGPQLWAVPFTKVRNEIYARSTDKKTKAPILVDDPEEGYDIVFTRVGTGLKSEYKAVEILRDPSRLHDDPKIEDRWLAYIEDHPLSGVLNYYDAGHIEKVLNGKADRRTQETVDEDGVVTEEPVRGRTSRREAVEEDEPRGRSPRRSTPAEDDGEADPLPANARRRALLDEGGVADPVDPPARRGRAALAEDEGEPSPVAAAKRSLERLKTRQGR